VFDGMTVTEVFEPYFRQMGLPVLKIKRNGGEYEIETDRFLFNEVKDKGFPKSSFEYKWHVPLVVQDNSGNDRVIWLKMLV
jgi:aminopeptidase N